MSFFKNIPDALLPNITDGSVKERFEKLDQFLRQLGPKSPLDVVTCAQTHKAAPIGSMVYCKESERVWVSVGTIWKALPWLDELP